MIKQITIRNFQAHDRLTIDFDKRVTTIVGRSDSGKSAIVRALRWVCLNKPAGQAFLSHGKNKVTVTALIGKQTITRSRGRANTYKLKDNKFHAFGNSVPEPIELKLNLDESINFQYQHDPVFWFALTPGQVSKELNRIFDLEAIDLSLGRIASTVKSATAKVEFTEERLRETKQVRNSLKWTIDANRDLKKIEELEDYIQQQTNRKTLLGSLISDLSQTTSELRRLQRIAEKYEVLNKLERRIESLSKERKGSEKAIKLLDQAIVDIEENQQRIAKCRKSLTLARREIKKLVKEKCPLCGAKVKS